MIDRKKRENSNTSKVNKGTQKIGRKWMKKKHKRKSHDK